MKGDGGVPISYKIPVFVHYRALQNDAGVALNFLVKASLLENFAALFININVIDYKCIPGFHPNSCTLILDKISGRIV